MLPWSAPLSGRLDVRMIESQVLRDNPLGDPWQRPIEVYCPPGYDDGGDRYPTIYVIQGYTGRCPCGATARPGDDVPRDGRRRLRRGEAPPAIVVFVDAWTAYGGSQFVDSPGTGRYHTYLCDEVVPWVDARYRTLRRRGAPRRSWASPAAASAR